MKTIFKNKLRIIIYFIVAILFLTFLYVDVSAEELPYFSYLNKNEKKTYKELKNKIDSRKGSYIKIKLKTKPSEFINALEAIYADEPWNFTGGVNLYFYGEARDSSNKMIKWLEKLEKSDAKQRKKYKISIKIAGLNNKSNSKKIIGIADSLDFSGRSDYEKIKAIHDWLCKNVDYDYYSKKTDTKNSLNGVFLKKQAVCEGYARAFKYLCDMEGIPCLLVPGMAYNSNKQYSQSHLWNYVRLDGDWYAVDTTWDDIKDSKPKYDYFLVGSDTIDSFGKSFNESHVADKNYVTFDLGIGKKIIKIPKLSRDKYEP